MGENFNFGQMFGAEAPSENGVQNSVQTNVQTNVQETVQTAQANVQPQAPVAQPQANAITAVSDDFEITFDDNITKALESKGIEVINVGDFISSVPIEKYRGEKGRVDRISFLTDKAIPVKYHYMPEIKGGAFLCFNGDCCKHDKAVIRYLFPICKYTTDNNGRVTDTKVTLKMLSAGKDLYKNINIIKGTCEGMGGLSRADFLIACTDSQYQKFTINFAGRAAWRTNATVANYLKEEWEANGAECYKAVAPNQVDAERFAVEYAKNHFDGANTKQQMYNSNNMDEIFGGGF